MGKEKTQQGHGYEIKIFELKLYAKNISVQEAIRCPLIDGEIYR